jgi:hypothetical protein
MAKKKPTSRTDAVRQAVDQAFQSQIPRERISELLDELGSTAGRLRGAVDDLLPASTDEVKTLRTDLEKLTARVDALEAAAKATPAPQPKPARRRTPAKPAASARAAASPAGSARSAAKSSASAASKPAATAAKPAAKPRKRAAAKPKPAAEGS